MALAAAGIGAVDAAVGAARAIAATPARPASSSSGRPAIYGGAQAGGPAGSERGRGGRDRLRVDGGARGETPTARRRPRSGPRPTRRLRAALARPRATPHAPRGVACPLAITRSAALGRRIAAATGAELENLEAFAVARAAAAAGVEFAAVLGVANRVGPTGHAEWRRHHRAASRAACALVARFSGCRAPPEHRKRLVCLKIGRARRSIGMNVRPRCDRALSRNIHSNDTAS